MIHLIRKYIVITVMTPMISQAAELPEFLGNADQTRVSCLLPSIIKLIPKQQDAIPDLVPKIGIPIRGNSDDKDGKGTFFDHYVFQRITTHKTIMLMPEDNTTENPLRHVRDFAKQLTYGLPHGVQDKKIGKKLPEIQKTAFHDGLLVTPGRMRDREFDKSRADHETTLIRQALRRGQPILAICAGSWRLWQEIWQQLTLPSRKKIISQDSILKEVSGHSASRMMSLSATTGNVTYNILLHGLSFKKDTFVYKFMGAPKTPVPADIQVNSVHWKAPKLPPKLNDEKKKLVDIAATSKNTKDTTVKNRHGDYIIPDEGEIEAFSLAFGAPTAGIVWHPEAFYGNGEDFALYNKILIRNMAKAGIAYAAKRRMLQEFNQIVTKAKKLATTPQYNRPRLEILLDTLHSKLGSDDELSTYTALSKATIYRLRTDPRRLTSTIEKLWADLTGFLNQIYKKTPIAKQRLLIKLHAI